MATCHPNLIGFNITNIFSINTSYKRQVPGLNKNTNSRVHLVPCTYVAVYLHQIRWTIYKELFIKKKLFIMNVQKQVFYIWKWTLSCRKYQKMVRIYNIWNVSTPHWLRQE